MKIFPIQKFFTRKKIPFFLAGLIIIIVTIFVIVKLSSPSTPNNLTEDTIETSKSQDVVTEYFIKLDDVNSAGIQQTLWVRYANGEEKPFFEDAHQFNIGLTDAEYITKIVDKIPEESKYLYFVIGSVSDRADYRADSSRLIAFNKENTRYADYTILYDLTAVSNPVRFSPDFRHVAIFHDQLPGEDDPSQNFAATGAYIDIINTLDLTTVNRYYVPDDSTFYAYKSHRGLLSPVTKWISDSVFQLALYKRPITFEDGYRDNYTLVPIHVVSKEDMIKDYDLSNSEFRHGFGDESSSRYHYVSSQPLYVKSPDGSWVLVSKDLQDIFGESGFECLTNMFSNNIRYIPCTYSDFHGLPPLGSQWLDKHYLKAVSEEQIPDALIGAALDGLVVSPSGDRVFVETGEIVDLRNLKVIHKFEMPAEASIYKVVYVGPPLGGGGREMGEQTGWQSNDIFTLQLFDKNKSREILVEDYGIPSVTYYDTLLKTLTVDLSK